MYFLMSLSSPPKVIVYLSDLLIVGGDKATNNLQKLNFENVPQGTQGNTREYTFMKVVYFVRSINKKILHVDSNRNPQKHLFDMYTVLLFQQTGLEFSSILEESDLDPSLFTSESLKRIAGLRILIDNGFVPIHPEVDISLIYFLC